MADAAHAPSDLWHRSLEDLLKAIETAEAKAASPVSFAINLQASTAPMAMPTRAFPRFEKLLVYQLKQRGRDNSPRFQLRLGIIESDLEADAILSTVRQYYPSATKEVIGEEDRTAIAQAASSVQNKAPAKTASNVSPMPRVPSKDVLAPTNAKADSLVEPRWNIDELLPNLANLSAVKRDRPSRAGVTTRVHQKTRSGAPPVRLSNVPIARTEAAKAATATTAPPPPIPVAPKAPPAAKPAEEVTPRTANPSVAASGADSGMLRALAAKIGTLTASPPSTPVVPKAPPVAKPSEAVTARPVSLPVAASVADSGMLRSLVAKIGTLTASPPSALLVPKTSPAAKPAEAVTARPVSPPVAASVADSGTLRSLVAKIGTLVDAVETHAEATAVSRPRATPVPATAISAPPAPAAATATAAAVPALQARAPAPVAIPSAGTAVTSVPQSPRTQRAPSIDSTQTFRALTAVELSDAETSLWFVIQLMQSQELIDPEQVPKLDIFSEYRLYSVSEPDEGEFMHALRLGFFSSEIAAQAVAGYLGSHFPAINIKRVSIAERDRFAEQQVVAKKDVGEEGNHTVIEFSAPPPLLAQVTAPVPTSNEADKGPDAPSFWSRLTRLRGA